MTTQQFVIRIGLVVVALIVLSVVGYLWISAPS